MFSNINFKDTSLTENFNATDYSIKCDIKRLHYLNIYLREKGFAKKEEGESYGQHYILWVADRNDDLSMSSIKYASDKEYQITVQFRNIEKPLIKNSKPRKFIEELLSVCKTDIMFSFGYLPPIVKGNVFLHFNGKNFVFNTGPIEETNIKSNIAQEIEKQRNLRDAYIGNK